jgi:hypothetical protein
MILAAGTIFFFLVMGYIFYPQRSIARQLTKSHREYLQERRDVLYENLRDLNFEFRAGKYGEEEYESQRNAMEKEAAQIVLEIASTAEPKDS